MLYLGNAFSLQMLAMGVNSIVNVQVEAVCASTTAKAVKDAQENDTFVCAIGHNDTANVVSAIIGVECPMNRASVTLHEEDELYVAQVVGGRLPEGATTLPEGIELRFYRVKAKVGEEKTV